ncbi:hypothetical protein BDB01DRAFT_851411 [Pilobolus umbonatus]|nr:hypothetical protein BDB01DRAFT_851411 [Pilobolus umbonatus]
MFTLFDSHNDVFGKSSALPSTHKHCPIRPPSNSSWNTAFSSTYNLFENKVATLNETVKHPMSVNRGLSFESRYPYYTPYSTSRMPYIRNDHIYQSNNIYSVHSSMTMNQSYSDLSTSSHILPCVKLSNIPWDVSQNDIRLFFGYNKITANSFPSIHIMMDRYTGKTLSDAYVEFANKEDVYLAIDTTNQTALKGRIITVTECSQEELLTVIFPKWRGQFYGISAIPPNLDIVRSMSTAAGGGSSGCPPFITREEINSLLMVCKNYKLHFSRKCAERPFENIISVIVKYPWHQLNLITTMHRDHIYEMMKLSIESLKIHLSKDYVHIDNTLLERLVRAGVMCPAFTERQKSVLIQIASKECGDFYLSDRKISPWMHPGIQPIAFPIYSSTRSSSFSSTGEFSFDTPTIHHYFQQ